MLTDELLELQRIDTTLDQLAHRRARLAEREQVDAAAAELGAAVRRRDELAARGDQLDVAITTAEHDGEALTSQKRRLEAQLRTVVAPREAEALMHELDTLARRRDELDDQELAHLEEQSSLADELGTLDVRLPTVRAQLDAAKEALGTAEATVDDEMAGLRSAREHVVGRIDGDLLARYDALRARFGGVAVARLEGSRCGGCHLDLSRAELDAVRTAGAGAFTDCPQCGRLLVA